MSILDVKYPDWMTAAVCATTSPDLFFIAQGKSPRPAKRVCTTCPVRLKCLTWAMDIEADEGQMPGIYGGMTTGERAALAKKKQQNGLSA